MAILIRRGLLSLFDKRKLRPGELAITTDGTKLYYCYSAGNVKEVVTVDDLQNITESMVSSEPASFSNTASGVEIYDGTRLRKNSFLVSGCIVLKLTGSFQKDSYLTLCEITPSPVKMVESVGEINLRTPETAVQFIKVRAENNGSFKAIFPEDISGENYLYAPITYFYK